MDVFLSSVRHTNKLVKLREITELRRKPRRSLPHKVHLSDRKLTRAEHLNGVSWG